MSKKKSKNQYCGRKCSSIGLYGRKPVKRYYGPGIDKLSEYSGLAPSTMYKRARDLKITKVIDQILDKERDIGERRKLLYKNANSEALENLADVLWERIIDKELGIIPPIYETKSINEYA